MKISPPLNFQHRVHFSPNILSFIHLLHSAHLTLDHWQHSNTFMLTSSWRWHLAAAVSKPYITVKTCTKPSLPVTMNTCSVHTNSDFQWCRSSTHFYRPKTWKLYQSLAFNHRLVHTFAFLLASFYSVLLLLGEYGQEKNPEHCSTHKSNLEILG